MPALFPSLRARYFIFPFLGLFAMAFSWITPLPWPFLLVLAVFLVVIVFMAVSHAEVLALRLGEPFGSLVLAIAVTVIEVGLILVLMTADPDATKTLARDTVFSAIMITSGAMVGGSILISTVRNKVAVFNPEGALGALAVLASLSILSLVLPTVTTSSPGPTFSASQLIFATVASLALYVTFLAMQTLRHRDYFLPPVEPTVEFVAEDHLQPPSSRQALMSLLGLTVALITVVGLAQVTSPLIQEAVSVLGLPQLVVAVSIAVLVLLPETISAYKAARLDRIQTSLNLAYGSALASIGLTIPAIAMISLLTGIEINLGLGASEIVLLILTLIVSVITVIPGRATILQGAVHLSIFGAFILVVFSP